MRFATQSPAFIIGAIRIEHSVRQPIQGGGNTMKNLSRTITVLAGIFAILTLAGTHFPCNVAVAQTTRGSLSGNVLDQSGAVIWGAKISPPPPNKGETGAR